jgi:hypothetical protein
VILLLNLKQCRPARLLVLFLDTLASRCAGGDPQLGQRPIGLSLWSNEEPRRSSAAPLMEVLGVLITATSRSACPGKSQVSANRVRSLTVGEFSGTPPFCLLLIPSPGISTYGRLNGSFRRLLASHPPRMPVPWMPSSQRPTQQRTRTTRGSSRRCPRAAWMGCDTRRRHGRRGFARMQRTGLSAL